VGEFASRWLADLTNRARYNGEIVGHIVRAEGSVRVLHLGDIRLVPSPVEKPIELRDGAQIQTSVDSKAIFILNSQDELELGASGLLQLQLWNPKDANSPIYLNSLLGSITLQKPGTKGRAYLVKDGRLYLPGQQPLMRPMALTVLRSAPLDLTLAENQNAAGSGGDFPRDDFSGEQEDAASSIPANAATPETLSNEYIDETIASRQAQLQKCWLTRLKDAPNLKGHLILQFEITRRGRVKDVRVTDASLEDETFTKCVISVLSRIQFRAYKGPEISLSYPIQFE